MLDTPAKVVRFLKRLVPSPNSRYLVKKPFIWLIVLFYVCLAVFFIAIASARVAQSLYDMSQNLRNLPYGYMILIVAMIVASFPPFIGHGTLLNFFGFTYGMRGFPYAVIGTLAASVIAFVTLRMMFAKRLRLRTSNNEKWRALEAVIRSRGMPLIILIRMSSLVPWAWSNSLFASISSVSLLQFFISTWFVIPRVWILVFVGSRLSKLSDRKQRSRMYARARILNSFLIVSGILLTVLASSLVYYFIRKEIKRLRAKRDDTVAETSEAMLFPDSTICLSFP